MNATHHTAPGGEGALVRHLNPTRLRDAAVAWVQHNGMHIRERGDELHFDWPDREDSRRNDPPCMLRQSSGAGWDAREGQVINAKALADRAGMQLREFLDRWAGEAFAPTRTTRPAPASPPDATSLAQWEKRTVALAAAWDALLSTGEDEDNTRMERIEAATLAWVTGTRGLFAPPHPTACVRVVDEQAAGPILAVCHELERQNLKNMLPVAVMPKRDPRNGQVRGIAWRQVNGGERKVLSGSKHKTPDGVPLVYGTRADLVSHARTVFLAEGMPDLVALEGLLPPPPPVPVPPFTAIAAVDAGQLPAVAQFIARHSKARVVLIPHLDDSGTGQTRTVEACKALGTRAEFMDWQRFVTALGQCGLPPEGTIKDLADAVRLASCANIGLEIVRNAFFYAAGGAA